MTAIISKLKSKADVQQLPVTHERAVKDDNGTTLETKLQMIDYHYNRDYEVSNGMGKKTLPKNNGVLTQAMMQDTNTIYVIQYDYTLGENITVPANCILEFEGGSLNNGTLVGNETLIATNYASIFDLTLNISGTFKNNSVFISWYKFNLQDDISSVFNNLYKISNTIIIDKECTLKNPVLFYNSDLLLDGVGNTLHIDIEQSRISSTDYYSIRCENNNFIKISNLNIVYNVISVPQPSADLNAIDFIAIYVYCGNEENNRKIEINNINISNFDTRINNTYPCSFQGICVQGFRTNAQLNIHNIKVSDCVVASYDRNEVYGATGVCYPIVIVTGNTLNLSSGQADIYNIKIENIFTYLYGSPEDLTYLKDASGIYLLGVNSNGEPTEQLTMSVRNCIFKNVSRRCFKIQGVGVKLENIRNIIDEEDGHSITYQDTAVDFQGYKCELENFYGDVFGTFVNVSNDYCTIKNCSIKLKADTSQSRLFTIATGTSLLVENCIFEGIDAGDNANNKNLIYIQNEADYQVSNTNNTVININQCKLLTSYNKDNSVLIKLSTQDFSGKKLNLNISNSILNIKGIGNLQYIYSEITINDCFIETSGDLVCSTKSFIILNTKINLIGGSTLGNYLTGYIKFENIKAIWTTSDTYSFINIGYGASDFERIFIFKNSEIIPFEDSHSNMIAISNNSNCIIDNIKTNKLRIDLYKNSGLIQLLNLPQTLNDLRIQSPGETYDETLKISWGLEQQIASIAIPYVVRNLGSMTTISDISIIAKRGIPYLYQGKIVHYNGSAWVDATGTPV